MRKFFILFGSALALSFILITPAYADISNPDTAQSLTTNSEVGQGRPLWGGFEQNLGTGITGTFHNISTTLDITGGSPGGEYNIYLWECTNPNLLYLGVGGCTIAWDQLRQSFNNGTGVFLHNFSDINYTADPTKDYWIEFDNYCADCLNTTTYYGTVYSGSTNVEEHYYNPSSGDQYQWSTEFKNLNIDVTGVSGGLVTPPVVLPSTVLDFPTTGSTEPLFGNWAIKVNSNGYPLSEKDAVGVLYSTNASSTLAFGQPDVVYDEGQWGNFSNFYPVTSDLYGDIPVTQLATPLWVTGNSTKTWYASPFYYSASTSMFTYGTTTTFSVNGNVPTASDVYTPQNITQYFSATNTLSNLNLGATSTGTICPDRTYFGIVAVPDIGCALEVAGQNLIQFLFIPSSSADQFLVNEINNFKGIFPFSVFFQTEQTVVNASNEINSGTSQDLNLTLRLPLTGTTTIQILTPTTISDRLGFAFTNFFFNLIIMAWILAFVITLFKVFF